MNQAQADETESVVRARYKSIRSHIDLAAAQAKWSNNTFEQGASPGSLTIPINTYYLYDFEYYFDEYELFYYRDNNSPHLSSYAWDCQMIRINGTTMDTSYSYTFGVSLQNPAGYGITQDEWNVLYSKPYFLSLYKEEQAQYQREADEARAAYVFTQSYTSAYRAQTVDDLDALETELSAQISAGRTLNTDVWSAAGTANSGYLSALQTSDSTSNILSYLAQSTSRQINLDVGLNNAFGDFQTSWRSDRLNGLSTTDPHYSDYSSDLTWSQRVTSARDNAYAELANQTGDFYDTLYDALGDLADTQMTAFSSYSTRAFNAGKTCASGRYNADATYDQSSFTAARRNALDLLDAEITELLANAQAERDAKQAKRQAITNFISSHSSQLNLPSGDFASIIASSDARHPLGTQFNDLKVAQTALATAAINAAKAQNAQNKVDTVAEANRDYEFANRSAYDTWRTRTLTVLATYNNALTNALESYQTTLENAQDSYNTTVTSAWNELQDNRVRINALLNQAVNAINNGNTIPTNYFTDPNISLEVCFVAGTPILMADGTTKPIEQIEPGDEVLAADHLNPTEKPTAAKVLRFFDNGLKSVVKLTFANPETNETQEITCTPEHPFYVITKGWTLAANLLPGDNCLSAEGKPIAFRERITLDAPQHVYNFEVEEKHTYFVGHNKCLLLVHNACWGWEIAKGFGSGLLTGAKSVANGISGAVVSTVTLGFKDYNGPFVLTETDISYGGQVSQSIARVSSEIAISALSGGAANLASKSQKIGLGTRRVLNTMNILDTAGNIVSVPRAGLDMIANGVNASNTVAMATSALGLTVNIPSFSITIPKNVPPVGYSVVSRWGRSGLESGDWIVKGDVNWINYLKSFKWDFLSKSNIKTPYSAGESFVVPSETIHWPSGWFTIDGIWKGLFGQRRYYE